MTVKSRVYGVCLSHTGLFRLTDVYNGCPDVSRAVVRHYTQRCRDDGHIVFVDNNGTYMVS